MSVLVTGGTGYIGSHTVKALLEKGEHVIVLDNLSRGHAEIARLLPGAEYIWGDTGDRWLLENVFRNASFDAVIHFAADSLVGESMIHPSKYYENNVVKGIALLEAARENGIQAFIFSSSAAVYGEPDQVPITERCRPNPGNAYGATKLAFEEALRWYGSAYGFRSISLRYFNAAGADPDGLLGEDHTPETHLIPLVLEAAAGKRGSITVYGSDYPTPDGTCIRDYVHVTDLAVAHVQALKVLRNGQPTAVLNLGSGRGFSVQEVISAVQQVTGCPVPSIIGERRSGDPAVLVASAELAREILDWKPAYDSLAVMIKTAWQWDCRHPNGYAAVAAPGGSPSVHRTDFKDGYVGVPICLTTQR
ncbi:MAG: UDP-glucose 4-epimerase GalE [Solirubrobacterales bacterium]